MTNARMRSPRWPVNDSCGGFKCFRGPFAPRRTVVPIETFPIRPFEAGEDRLPPSPPRPLAIWPCAVVIPAPLRVA